MVAKKSDTKDTYSVILPTFNERQNLPVITWLLARTFQEKYVTDRITTTALSNHFHTHPPLLGHQRPPN